MYTQIYTSPLLHTLYSVEILTLFPLRHPHSYMQWLQTSRGPTACQGFFQTQRRLLHAAITTRWTEGKLIRADFFFFFLHKTCLLWSFAVWVGGCRPGLDSWGLTWFVSEWKTSTFTQNFLINAKLSAADCSPPIVLSDCKFPGFVFRGLARAFRGAEENSCLCERC